MIKKNLIVVLNSYIKYKISKSKYKFSTKLIKNYVY